MNARTLKIVAMAVFKWQLLKSPAVAGEIMKTAPPWDIITRLQITMINTTESCGKQFVILSIVAQNAVCD